MSAESQSWYHDFYQELKRRRVMRVAALYIVLFWPVIQIADILSPALDLPPEAMRYLLIVFAVGLPIAMGFSWLFDLNKTGVERVAAEASGAGPGQALIGRLVERVIIGLLVVVIAVLSYMQYNSQTNGAVSANRTVSQLSGSDAAMTVRAIAVLPFVTFSGNSDDQFFSDGLTEELLNVLSKLQNLRVTARTSSFAYKGVNKNIQEIGRELKVDTILEGSVRRNDVDDTIRVTAQLIEIETGTHLWSQTFDREYRDVFKIQDDIAAAVISQLKVALGDGEKAKLVSRDAANPEAMVATSMGRAELAKRTQQSLIDATRYFERAIKANPTSADPHAGLANAYALLVDYPGESTEPLEKAQQAAATALQLDATSADAWAAQGLIDMQRDDWSAAREAMQKAMSLNPSHAMATMWFGNLQEDEAQRREFHTRAFELDPHSPVAGYNLASDLIRAGREAEAMDVFTKIVDADPHYPLAYQLVGQINEFRGRLDEAIHYYKRAYELEQRGDVAAALANLYIDIGDFESADEWIAAAVAHLPEKNLNDIEWLKISALTARGNQTGANQLLLPLLESAGPSVDAYLNAVSAGYFLLEHQAAISAWEKAQALEPVEEQLKTKRMMVPNLEASIAAAYAYAETGQRTKSVAVLAGLESWLDGQMAEQVRVNPQLWFVKAQVSAIKGESSLALIHLQRAIDEGWRQHWRPGVEPCFAQLRDLPTFQSMMAGLVARMSLMREQLEFESEFATVGS